MVETLEISRQKFFGGQSNKVENHPARLLKCFGHDLFSGFPIEMTNDVPTLIYLPIHHLKGDCCPLLKNW
jgi:hypothetical protein